MYDALMCYSGSSPSQNGSGSPDSAECIIPSYSTVHVVKSSVSIECVCVCVRACVCVCARVFDKVLWCIKWHRKVPCGPVS